MYNKHQDQKISVMKGLYRAVTQGGATGAGQPNTITNAGQLAREMLNGGVGNGGDLRDHAGAVGDPEPLENDQVSYVEEGSDNFEDVFGGQGGEVGGVQNKSYRGAQDNPYR
jgi:hypothetical protein